MGGGGGLLSGIFGGGQSSTPSVPEYEAAPVRESETEAEAKSVRDEEKRKLKGRRAMSGTVLTSPLGIVNNAANRNGVLGASFNNENQ